MAAKKKTYPAPYSGVSDILERVTRAEERVVHMDQRQEEWRDETRQAHADLGERLGKLEVALNKYQGAWGMLTLVLSALMVAGTLLKNWIMARLGAP